MPASISDWRLHTSHLAPVSNGSSAITNFTNRSYSCNATVPHPLCHRHSHSAQPPSMVSTCHSREPVRLAGSKLYWQMPRRCLRGSHRAHGLIKPMITMPDDLITTCTRCTRCTPSKPVRPCPCCVVHVWHVPAALPVPMPASMYQRLAAARTTPSASAQWPTNNTTLHQPIVHVQRYWRTGTPCATATSTLHSHPLWHWSRWHSDHADRIQMISIQAHVVIKILQSIIRACVR